MSARTEGRDGLQGADGGDRGRGLLRAAMAWGISILAHGAVIGLMVMVVRVVLPPADDRPVVVVSFDDPGLARRPEPALNTEPEFPETAPTPAPAPPPPVEPIEAPAPMMMPPDPAAVAPSPRVEAPPPVMMAEPPEVEFVGLGAGNARDIVYVVDGSGSMISAMPIVLRELERSLRKLESMQRFQILIFQNDGFVSMPMPGRAGGGGEARLVRARAAQVDAALAWAAATRPSGRSDPLEALEAAMKLKPDAVFLLTTEITGSRRWSPGERASFMEQLERINPLTAGGRARVPIKTILFLDEDASGIIPEIGRRFGGEEGFVFRSRRDLGL